MIDYEWFYLTTSPTFLSLTLDWLPREGMRGLGRMVVVAYDLPRRLQDNLRRACEACAPGWLDWEVRDVTEQARDIGKTIPGRFATHLDNPKPRWSLGIKQLVPLLVPAPVLYTDDDVLVVRDPAPMIEAGPFIMYNGLDHMSISPRDVRTCEQLAHCFGLPTPWDPCDYNERSVDTGVWYADEAENWLPTLRAYWRLPFLEEPDAGTNLFRINCLRWGTAWSTAHGWRLLKGLPDRRFYCRSPEKTPPRTDKCTFIHYCATSHKDEYVRRFRELLHARE